MQYLQKYKSNNKNILKQQIHTKVWKKLRNSWYAQNGWLSMYNISFCCTSIRFTWGWRVLSYNPILYFGFASTLFFWLQRNYYQGFQINLNFFEKMIGWISYFIPHSKIKVDFKILAKNQIQKLKSFHIRYEKRDEI